MEWSSTLYPSVDLTPAEPGAALEGVPGATIHPVAEMVKIQLDFDLGREWVWALPVADHRYSLRNIPAYASGVSLNDIVEAQPDEDGALLCVRVVRRGGHSTYHVASRSDENASRVQGRLDTLVALGCDLERASRKLVAVDVPPGAAID